MKPRAAPPKDAQTAARPAPSPASSSSAAKPATTKQATAEDVARAFERGAITLGAALGVTPAQKEALKKKAFAALSEKKSHEAAPLLEGLVALDPFDVWALCALATLKMELYEVPLAKALLDRALEVAPNDVTARALRAEARFKSGDEKGAAEDAAVVVKDAGAKAPALSRLATVLPPALLPKPKPATTTKAPTTTTKAQKATQKR